MNLPRLLCASALATLAGCAASSSSDSPAPTQVGGKQDGIAGIASCSGAPAGFGNPSFLAYGNQTGTVYVPTNVTAASELWIVFGSNLPTYYGTQSATLHYSTDNWKTVQDVALAQWCTTTTAEGDTVPLFGLSLGKLALGTTVALDVHHITPPEYYLRDPWLNNGGKNYQFTIAAPAPLAFVGDSALAVGGVAFDASAVPRDQAITVSAQSYPAGAGVALAVNWVDGSGHSGAVPMAFASTGAGASADNDLWTATLPASVAGAPFTYYISATDSAGNALRDVPPGSETKVAPVAYPISWAGDLGCYMPYDGDNEYEVGCDFAADGSTTFGCNTHGADDTSYAARAVQLYIPGITDRTFASPAAAAAFATTLIAQVSTNATKSGWGTIPAMFEKQLGHNFVYTFFNYDDLCPVGPPQTPIADGSYQYQLEFSSDGGASYDKLGTSTLSFAVAGDY